MSTPKKPPKQVAPKVLIIRGDLADQARRLIQKQCAKKCADVTITDHVPDATKMVPTPEMGAYVRVTCNAQAGEILADHNAWRRGYGRTQVHPLTLGEAIAKAVDVLKADRPATAPRKAKPNKKA